MTAEFAVALPAVVLVLVLAVGSILLATQRLTLASAAAQIARLEARGDAAAASAVLGEMQGAVRGGLTVQRATQGPLHCVTLRASPAAGLLSTLSVSGRSCAAISRGGEP